MFTIHSKGKRYVIFNDAGQERGEFHDFDTAKAALESLRKAQRKERSINPAIQERRVIKAAYRLAERDPYLRMLKNCLLRKGEIQRNTERGYNQSLAFLDKVIFNRTPDQRRTAAATETRQQQSEETRKKYLALQAQGKNQKEVARILGITPRGLRKLIKGR